MGTEKHVKKQEKQIRLFIVLMLFLVVSIFLIYFLIERARKFNYSGLEFVRVKQGNLILYNAQFPYLTGKVINQLSVYFREDPRKLDRINIQGNIRLKKVVALSASPEIFGCEDNILALSTLSLYLGNLRIKTIGAVADQEEADKLNLTYASCNDTSKYSVLVFKNGTESKITQKGDCYILESKDCEIMNVTERFMLGIYAHAKGVRLK
jgi:hypothetical protein